MGITTASVLPGLGRASGPFQVVLDGLGDTNGRLICNDIVRIIPGKRIVCRADWQGEIVFVKFYISNVRGRQHWEKELKGLRAMQSAGIACPEILYEGAVDNNSAKVVMLKAIPGKSFLEVWDQTLEDRERKDYLQLLAEVIAGHHEQGLEHQDPHLENFLIRDKQIYTLDGGDLLVCRGPVQTTPSLKNLGLVLAQMEPRYDAYIRGAFEQYCRQRGWKYSTELEAKLVDYVGSYRSGRRKRYLKKAFRECTEFVSKKERNRFIVFRRDWDNKALRQLLSVPDAGLQEPGVKMLKDGNTCTVWSVPVEGTRLVIKRYNIKGPVHGLGRALRRTRASRSWENAHRLKFYGIACAAPVALVEERRGFLRGKAWFITEEVNSLDCVQWLKGCDADADAGEVRHRMEKLVALLVEMAKLGITHGDMKGSNILVQDQQPAWVDLDAMQQPVCRALFLRQHRRDIRRFLQNWDEEPNLQQQMRDLLQDAGLPLA